MIIVGSGKFVTPAGVRVSYASSSPSPEEVLNNDVSTEADDISPDVAKDIPPLPTNQRHKFIRLAEEYFGKYWFFTLIVILILLIRNK